MMTFKQFFDEDERNEKLAGLKILFEYKVYKCIPGTNNSYREDPANTTTNTQRHSHVYAKRNGSGKELYSVNIIGSGHDGSRGVEIPASHADYFRLDGYTIKSDNILECVTLRQDQKEAYLLIILVD